MFQDPKLVLLSVKHHYLENINVSENVTQSKKNGRIILLKFLK